MKAMTIVVIIIAILVLATALWYTQTYRASLASTPAPTTTMPTAATSITTPTPAITTPTTMPPASMVTAKVNLRVVDLTIGSGNWVLIINGTVRNDSPNTAYGVGLHVFALADAALNPFEVNIDVTVPVASGTYDAESTYGLSTIPPNQSVPINIEIILPLYIGEFTVAENATATVVWSNMST